ncbi:MAG: cupin domain-containing protein [Elusimicrobia bacterium]|nr:cupin domain-containing protein [Elusimicrobiota bacterium]
MRQSLIVMVFAVAALAQPSVPAGGEVRVGQAGQLDWKPSTNLPVGAEYHLIREDPVTHGIEALVRFPSGYSIPSHSHDAEETLVVLRGKIRVKAGAEDRVLSPGDYVVLPKGVPHELQVKGLRSAELLAVTDGPFSLKK